MANDEKRSEGGMPSTGVLWLVLIGAGALFLKQVPWEGSRPIGPEPKPYSYAATQDVDARLWQDPIGAVARGREEARRRAAVSAGESAKLPASNPHTADGLAENIRERVCKDTDVLVIAVMVGGGPYPELVEARRRVRYAVLAGLNETGFVPDDEEHLGYIEPGYSKTPSTKGGATLPDFIAYEWMIADNSALPSTRPTPTAAKGSAARAQAVLVLWLDEDIFWRDTQAKIQRVTDLLVRKCEGKGVKDGDATLRIAVLGPGYTSTLQDMIKNTELVVPVAKGKTDQTDKKDKANKSPAPSPPIAYYVYGATADDKLLLPAKGEAAGGNAISVHDYFLAQKIPLFRTVTTDDRLAAKLKEELSRRRIRPDKNLEPEVKRERQARHFEEGKHLFDLACADDPEIQSDWKHIVLIAERDTSYGRSLPRAMAKEFAGPDRCRDNDKDDYPPWVHTYSYLRGLDGQLPAFQASGDASTGKKVEGGSDAKLGGADQSSDPKRIERPEGQGQFDYLRRMTDQLRAIDDDLRVKKRGRIRAFGVLGTDAYDKLLILQALRAQFPDVLVFTTDMDARLLHPQQLEWTHNAIIASGFGLQLLPQLQRDIPPFRDTYQTSLYLSTMIAVSHARHLAAMGSSADACRSAKPEDEKKCFGITQADISNWLSSPRVFEIGRKTAFDFSQIPKPGSVSPPACSPGGLDACEFIHPMASRMYPDPASSLIQTALRLLVGAVLLIGLATGKWGQIGSWIVRTPNNAGSVALRGGVAASLLALAAVGLYYLDSNIGELWRRAAEFLTKRGEGEPIALLQGVSTWPTELMRVVAFVLSVWFILRGWRALDRNLDEISTQMMWQPERRALMRELHENNKHWHWWIRVARMFSFRLTERGGGRINPDTGLKPDAELFWQKYIYQGRWWARFLRILLVTVIYHETFRFVSESFGTPMSPLRGEPIMVLGHGIAYWTTYAMQFLLFSVVDATVFCHQMVSSLRRKLPSRPVDDPAVATGREEVSRWPQKTLDHYAAKLHLDKRYLDDWIAMHFVARRTHTVAGLVYYPFVVIALIVVSRSTVFDNWGTPLGLVLQLSCSVLIVVGCAIALRSGAEALRRAAIWRLTNAKIMLNKDEEGERTGEQIDVMIDQIRDFDTGAFAPYSKQPLVRALLIPLTSFGGTALAEYASVF
jgi:hypothetical protein